MSSRILRSALVGLAAVGAYSVFAPTVAHAAEMGGLAVRPATFDPNDPATRAYFKPLVAPGSSYSGAVVIGNTSAQPMTVFVYPVDGLTSQTSGAVYANHSDPVHKAGQWVTVSQSTVTLAPNSQTQVGFRVDVPADAAPGDHLAGVAVEQAAVATSHPDGSAFTVNEVVRDVVGVSVKVPGAAGFTLSQGTPKLEALAGTANAVVDIPLSSTGGALGKATLAVTVSGGPTGYHRSVTRQLDTILPGDSITYPFIWPDDLQAGDYQISVAVQGTDNAVPAVTAGSSLGTTLSGATAPGASKLVTVLQAGGGGMAKGMTLALGVGLLLLVGSGLGAARAVRRRLSPANS